MEDLARDMGSNYSPAMSDFSDAELDAYFANYVPLSNLPTPPPAREGCVEDLEVDGERVCDSELAGPSTHLANLVPSNASTHRPSISIIHDFLFHAGLPLETVAFAACILDALSTRFVSSWRTVCSADTWTNTPFEAKIICKPASRPIEPEIMVLAALALAVGFLHDQPRGSTYWATFVALQRFTNKQLNDTKTCMLKDLDYGLHRFTVEMVQEAMRGMQCAGARPVPTIAVTPAVHCEAVDAQNKRPKLSLGMQGLMQGAALWVNGVQTPEPSP